MLETNSFDSPRFQPTMLARIDDQETPVKFKQVGEWITGKVFCEVYECDETKDYHILHIAPKSVTPPILITEGHSRTIERLVKGNGVLVIKERPTCPVRKIYPVDGKIEVTLPSGAIMQWQNLSDTEELTCDEICYPPYSDYRFISLREENIAAISKEFIPVSFEDLKST